MTIEEKAREIGIDWETSLKRFCGNKQLYVNFLKRFTEDKNFQKLKESWEKRDIEGCERSAHTLKGTCANLGLNVLSEKCAKIVEAMRMDNPGAQFDNDGLFSDCEKEYEKIWKALKEMD